MSGNGRRSSRSSASRAIAGLPGDVFEAARDRRRQQPGRRFRRILLPLLAPQLAAIFLLRLVIAFKIFDLVYVLTFGGPGFHTTTAELPHLAPGAGAVRCRPRRRRDA